MIPLLMGTLCLTNLTDTQIRILRWNLMTVAGALTILVRRGTTIGLIPTTRSSTWMTGRTRTTR